jgi:dihydrofolate reductase
MSHPKWTPFKYDISIIAAVAQNGVIGRDGGLPWKLPSDLRQFRAITLGHAVIMGRKTFEGLKGGPFDRRFNIVVTRTGNVGYFGGMVEKAMSLEHAVDIARNFTASHQDTQRIFIIGGGEIFREAITFAGHMRITCVRATPEGGVTFPDISPVLWEITHLTPPMQSPLDEAVYNVATYKRRD